ncbi:GMC oxidoreductase [Xylariaceae sp. FL0016]|nr:GMC oxidoreductase [Xylariaceae sp. FL0016]
MAAAVPPSGPVNLTLPPLPATDFFTPAQWDTLFAMLDAVTPSIAVVGDGDKEDATTTTPDDKMRQLRITETQCQESYERVTKSMQPRPSYDRFKAYLAARPLDDPEFVTNVRRTLGNLPATARKELSLVLSMLGSKLGSLAATGHCVPVAEQPLHIREDIMKAWDVAWLNIWPTVGLAFQKIAKASFAVTDQLFLEMSGYRRHMDDYKPGETFDYKFMQFPASPSSSSSGNDDSEPAVVVDADVVIVGSGCGGAVCAKVLAEAGHSVVVVDKGYYFPPSELPMTTEAAQEWLYESGGAQQSVDGTISWVAGSNWGGGGSVNWSASLQLQGFVRQEWASKGLGFFASQEFQNCLDRVCEVMGVSDEHVRHNHGNTVILDGAKKLGWHAKPVPQNTGGHEHYCGTCFQGCGSGEKQGPNVTWLPAAAKAGARFIEGMKVDKVLFEQKNGSKKAVGIVGSWAARDEDGRLEKPLSERVQRTVEVRAKKVIVSGGTLNSPLLLTRSGLKNRHIGRNLYTHPAAGLHAAYDKDVNGWEGGILTSVCTSFENLDGKGHGVKLESSVMIPYVVLFEHPWENALQYKTDAVRVRQMNNCISIVRDRDTGRVYADPADGRPVIEYSTSAFDRKNQLVGVLALCKLVYIQGATEIWPRVPGVPSFKRTRPVVVNGSVGKVDLSDEASFDEGINDPEFRAWLALLERTGLGSPRYSMACAHQMGTCRMATSPRDGVVDPRGRVWESEGLYVADASVFPSASGVNPMITNMAIADHIARGLDGELKREAKLEMPRASL